MCRFLMPILNTLPIGFCIKCKAINRKNNCSAGNIMEYSVRRLENSILFAAVSLVQS